MQNEPVKLVMPEDLIKGVEKIYNTSSKEAEKKEEELKIEEVETQVSSKIEETQNEQDKEQDLHFDKSVDEVLTNLQAIQKQ